MLRRFLAAGVLALAASGAFASSDLTMAGVGPAVEMQQTKIEDSAPVAETTIKSGRFAFKERFAGIANKAGTLIDTSLSLIGIRYKWGGNDESEGFDCSGFVKKVYETSIGMSLPRTALEMSRRGQDIKKAELKPGDLVFFNTMKRTFSHVGIYLGANRFIHAPRTGATIRVDNMDNAYWESRFNGGRRMADLSDDATTGLMVRSEGMTIN